MHPWRLSLLVIAPLLSGCFGGGGLQACEGHEGLPVPEPGVERDGTLCVDGHRRDLVLVFPDPLDAGAPLVIALHGGAGRADNMMDKTGLHDEAGDMGAIVAYPEGTPAGRAGHVRTWNAMHCCGRALDDGSDDVAFLAAIVDALRERGHADEVYVTGHSNGAMMAYRFAAERAGLVDGVAAVAGAIGGQATSSSPQVQVPTPSRPVPVLIMHAFDDEHVLYDGGHGPKTIGSRVDMSVVEAREFWRDANHAHNLTLATEEGPYDEQVYEPEGAGAVVHLVTTQGGHGWPGDDKADAPASPDASDFIMDWFDGLRG